MFKETELRAGRRPTTCRADPGKRSYDCLLYHRACLVGGQAVMRATARGKGNLTGRPPKARARPRGTPSQGLPTCAAGYAGSLGAYASGPA